MLARRRAILLPGALVALLLVALVAVLVLRSKPQTGPQSPPTVLQVQKFPPPTNPAATRTPTADAAHPTEAPGTRRTHRIDDTPIVAPKRDPRLRRRRLEMA